MVSVIIPVYNVEKYLRECVDSVLNQTYRNFEIILVDDGSKDGSSDICDAYAERDERIRCVHKENGGASSARNVGMDTAQGEYVYFLDSDDLLSHDAFEKLYAIAEHENADIVFFEAETFSEVGTLKSGNYGYSQQYGTQKGFTLLEQLIPKKEFHVSIPLLFINRQYLQKFGRKLCEGIMYEDMIFTFQLMIEAERVSHCGEQLYRRRYRAASVMTMPKQLYNFTSAGVVYYELLQYVSAKGFFNSQMVSKYLVRCAMNCLNLYAPLSTTAKKKGRQVYQGLKQSILNNGAFGSRALKARCYGKIPWAVVRGIEKIGI